MRFVAVEFVIFGVFLVFGFAEEANAKNLLRLPPRYGPRQTTTAATTSAPVDLPLCPEKPLCKPPVRCPIPCRPRQTTTEATTSAPVELPLCPEKPLCENPKFCVELFVCQPRPSTTTPSSDPDSDGGKFM